MGVSKSRDLLVVTEVTVLTRSGISPWKARAYSRLMYDQTFPLGFEDHSDSLFAIKRAEVAHTTFDFQSRYSDDNAGIAQITPILRFCWLSGRHRGA